MFKLIQRFVFFIQIKGRGLNVKKLEDTGQISVSWGMLRSSTIKEKKKEKEKKNISHLIKHWARLFSNNKAITNLFNKTWYAHWAASLVADSPITFSHQDRADQQQSVHLAKLNSTPMASSFRCGEDRRSQAMPCLHLYSSTSRSSEDGAEELLLSERVLGGGDGHDEGVLAYVSVAVRHQVCSCFGHLKCWDKGEGTHTGDQTFCWLLQNNKNVCLNTD